MAPFDFEVVHIPGTSNIADFLSRHPMSSRKDEVDDVDDYITAIVEYSVPKSVNKQDLLTAILSDSDMLKLSEMIKHNRFLNHCGLDKYKKVFEELTVTKEGFILRDTRLVIPNSFQNQIISIAHEGHLGIVKTKKLLRSKVWFPNIDAMVKILKRR